MPRPIPHYCVAQVWMNGVKTVQTFHTQESAEIQAFACANVYRGNLVYLGELVEYPTDTEDNID